MNAIEILKQRGFIYQQTHEQELTEHLNQSRTFYIGFDPTADSLHVGSLVPIMAMVHMQAAGHIPIAIVGGGTARVGDPSGKTEMRKMLSEEQITENEKGIEIQLKNYLTLDGQQGKLINNKDWLLPLSYIHMLREIGAHFSVNRMMTAESVRQRMETGLSFLEFNYMILQAYDFYRLLSDHDCTLQMGGQDQWGNIVAGIDLCRRKECKQQAYGVTFPLITNSSGAKFGKSESGNIWLDPSRTSPLEFYQFWRNVEDTDVKRFMLLFTLLPVDEINTLTEKGSNINRAKEILAFEATRITHGEQQAAKAFATAVAKFGQADPKGVMQTSSSIVKVQLEKAVDMPRVALAQAELGELTWADLYIKAELTKTKGEAKRLIRGNGGRYGNTVIQKPDEFVDLDHFQDGKLILRAGKKRFKLIELID
ncbi:MAG: tyrosine--tRNA ligase [Acidobacteria bacterium]|nr:MAG: tyrosine--tRNA ligase [Acidobacteriota bacterium]